MPYYNIAGLNIKLDCAGKTLVQAESYSIDKPENIDFEINQLNIDQVIDMWLESGKILDYSKDILDYLASGALFYQKLTQYEGMMLHSSAVVVDGRAYLFTANPGTGKSTHTSLWLNLFPSQAYILNDDKPAVRLEGDVWYAYGTPWSGKNDISVNARVPIGGVAFLERAAENSITPMNPGDAAMALLMQINRSRFPESMDKLLDLYDKFVQDIPIWKLQCNMDPEAAIVSYEAMSGEKFVPTTEM